MHSIAVIGTAGRDKTKPMTRKLWMWMVHHAMHTIPAGNHLISGGAAWADHLAVCLFLEGHAKALTLHLPAPLGIQGFNGPERSSATAANYYHTKFSEAIGYSSFQEILEATDDAHCQYTHQAEAPGYGAMFARNLLVARNAKALIAYTFGEGTEPADGGTRDTWNKSSAIDKLHVSLPCLY